MARYLTRRVATSILMLVATSVLIFAILRLLPGDPVLTRLGATPGVDAGELARLRDEAGLDRPLIAQYLSWIGGVAHGDFGSSYFSQFSVTELISRRIGPTLLLTFLSVALAVALAVPAALACANWPGSWFDRTISGFVTAGIALPPFVIGVVLIVLFSVKLGWLPARGYVSPGDDPAESLRHLLLPAATLALVAAPLVMRYLRASLLETMSAPFIRTAQGKGASRARILFVHALGNAAVPALTMLGLIVGFTLGGVVIVEYVFGFPGLGSLAVEAVFKRDYAVLQSAVLLIGALFIATTLAVDLLCGVIDPRLRVNGGRS